MKKSLIFLILMSWISGSVFSQVPGSFNYQAVLRDNSGTVIADPGINVKISILKDLPTGAVVYSEDFITSSYPLGVINLAVGTGVVSYGIFDTIHWIDHDHYLKVEVDTAQGSDFVHLGTTQLLSVPYALATGKSKSAVKIMDADEDTWIGTEEYPDEDKIRFFLDSTENMRLEKWRLVIMAPNEHLIIGDSAGMDEEGNSQTTLNTFIGFKSGSKNQGGNWNTFLGNRSGENHVYGDGNVFVGAWTGISDSSGRLNTFLGSDAGGFNKTGWRNTFVGYGAGAFHDSLHGNTFIGAYAGLYNKGGQDNVYLGFDAGRNSGPNGGANSNTYIGSNAGRNNQDGSGNVFVGNQAGINTTESNLLIIDNSDRPDPFIYGEFDNRHLHFNARYFLIGESNEIISANGNVIIGDSAGYSAGHNGSRSQNVYIGDHSAYSDTSGKNNVFIGSGSGWDNLSGERNVFIGRTSGAWNSTGFRNTFVGMQTGFFNTTGSKNTFLGNNAGMMHSTGFQNTFLGNNTGLNHSTGSYNTFLGESSGVNNVSGEKNVFVGFKAGFNELGSDKLYIANSDTISPLIYGEFNNALLKLHSRVDVVDHDVYINDYSKGVILTSPDGSCWRITADDSGNLVSTAVECP